MLFALFFADWPGWVEPALDVAAHRETDLWVDLDGDRAIRFGPVIELVSTASPFWSSESLELIDIACCDCMFSLFRYLFVFAAILADMLL